MSFFFETVEIGWPSASSRQGYAWRSGLTQGGHHKASIKNPDIGKDSPCASRIKPPLSPAPPAVSARKSLYLHRLDPLQGSLGAQSALCHRQAWLDRPLQGCRQERRRAWRALQRHLSRLCPHALGREADSEISQGPWDQRAGRHQECHAEGNRQWPIHDRRGYRRGGADFRRLPLERADRSILG